jgi:alanine racemase
MMHHQQQVEWVVSADLTSPVTIWLKLESGMNRLGFLPEVIDQVCADLLSSSNVQAGMVLCTQLACADDLTSPVTMQQLSIMRSCAGKYNLDMSIANSAAIMSWSETHAAWNRPGYMLYGINPFGSYSSDSFGLIPAMTMRSEIITIKELKVGQGTGYGLDWLAKKVSRVGTVAIGYGDGYPRHAPSGTPVLVNGQRVPLIGRVSMDLISVDLTDLKKVEVGDPVELWGQELSVNEVAAAAGTIGYEILAGLTGRVPLVY